MLCSKQCHWCNTWARWSKPPWWKCKILYWDSLLAITSCPDVQFSSLKNNLRARIWLRSTENLLHFNGAACFLLTIGDAETLSGNERLCLYAKVSGLIQLANGLVSSWEVMETVLMNSLLVCSINSVSTWASGALTSKFSICGFEMVMLTEVTLGWCFRVFIKWAVEVLLWIDVSEAFRDGSLASKTSSLKDIRNY